jgi:hypothetical protein
MNTGELIAEVRQRLNDTAGNKTTDFWTDANIVSYANAARDRLFLLVRRLIIDSTTATDADAAPLCRITLVPNTAKYALSRKILGIIRLKLALQTQPLEPSSLAELDAWSNWEAIDAASPLTYCTDIESDSITFVPAPLVADTVSMTVFRSPLAKLSLADKSADLGFREEYHEDLIPWILHLAFRKQDAEIYNANLAEEYRRTFLDRAAEIKLEMYRHHNRAKGNKMKNVFGIK